MVFRFGAALSRATAMRLLGGGGLPGVKPSDVVVRVEPGPHPGAAPADQGVAAHAGRRRAADRRGRLRHAARGRVLGLELRTERLLLRRWRAADRDRSRR